MRRSKSVRRPASAVIVATVLALLSATVAGATPEEVTSSTKEQFKDLIAAQAVDNPIAVGGDTDGLDGGIVLAELAPSQTAREKMQVGDSYPQLIIAAAPISSDGDYELRLDETNRMVQSSGQLVLTFVDSEDRIRGMGVASLLTDSGERSSAPAEVNFNAEPQGERPNEATEETTGEPVVLQAADYNCAWYVKKTGILAPATLIVAGTNTNGATVSPKFANTTTSKLGFSSKVSGGSWVEASGEYSVTNSSGVTKTWPASNAYGTFSFRMQTSYTEEELTCIYGGPADGMRQQVPVGYTGGSFDPVKWGTTQYPTYCVPQATGPITFETSTATKWNAGVKLSWPAAGSINVDAQSGYTNKTSVTFNYTEPGKYLCGKNNFPANTPGYLMADWADR